MEPQYLRLFVYKFLVFFIALMMRYKKPQGFWKKPAVFGVTWTVVYGKSMEMGPSPIEGANNHYTSQTLIHKVRCFSWHFFVYMDSYVFMATGWPICLLNNDHVVDIISIWRFFSSRDCWSQDYLLDRHNCLSFVFLACC